jgi:hypothetical protein
VWTGTPGKSMDLGLGTRGSGLGLGNPHMIAGRGMRCLQ